MSFWVIFQVVLNIGLISLGLVIWARVTRPQKDDPRLSRGLQLLQSKIAILEDLSDRTDNQVKQLTQYMEEKAKEIDSKVSEAQEQIQKVEVSIEKSLEVSKIFQDKIPHKEIIERQNTLKYIQAARLAHQGVSAEEISEKIDIPMSELEFIVKVNKNKLVFSEEHLPEWVPSNIDLETNLASEMDTEPVIKPSLARNINWSFENTNEKLEESVSQDKKVQEEFKKAVAHTEKQIDENKVISEIGIETGIEAMIEKDDLKSSIQKARNLISKTLDKTFEPKEAVSNEPAVRNQDLKNSNVNLASKVIKKEDAEVIQSYNFKRIDTL